VQCGAAVTPLDSVLVVLGSILGRGSSYGDLHFSDFCHSGF
jgi:hypothetical protein